MKNLNLKKFAKRFFLYKYTELIIFFFILLSVVIIFLESIGFNLPKKFYTISDDFFFIFFSLELFLRYQATGNFKKFIRLYWLDIIAILPFFRPFRLIRGIRILRIFRLASIGIILSRHLEYITSIFSKKYINIIYIFIFLLFIIIFNTISFMYFEKTHFLKSLWINLFSLLSGEYSTEYPANIFARFIIIFTNFSGMVFFAIITGTTSAVMIDKLLKGGFMKEFSLNLLEDHIIICGWSSKVPLIIKEINDRSKEKPIFVIISQKCTQEDIDNIKIDKNRKIWINKDFINIHILNKLNIKKAKNVVILAEETFANMNINEIDARTVLTALTIEKLNPEIHTTVELINPSNQYHLKLANVEDIIIAGKYSSNIIANAIINSEILPFLDSALSIEDENIFKTIKAQNIKDIENKNFLFALNYIKKNLDYILIAVKSKEKGFLINPSDYIIKNEDILFVLAKEDKK